MRPASQERERVFQSPDSGAQTLECKWRNLRLPVIGVMALLQSEGTFQPDGYAGGRTASTRFGRAPAQSVGRTAEFSASAATLLDHEPSEFWMKP